MAKNDTLQKHTLNLRVGDMERLREFFPDIPASSLIRTIISRYVDSMEGNTPQTEVDISI